MVNAPVVFAATVSDMAVVCVMPPPLPVTVMLYVPATAVEPTESVSVDDPAPGAAIEVGLKLAVTFVGKPLADKAIAASKPPEIAVVIFDVPLLPCVTVSAVGEAEIVNAGDALAVTVSDTVVLCVMPPPLPVTVMV